MGGQINIVSRKINCEYDLSIKDAVLLEVVRKNPNKVYLEMQV